MNELDLTPFRVELDRDMILSNDIKVGDIVLIVHVYHELEDLIIPILNTPNAYFVSMINNEKYDAERLYEYIFKAIYRMPNFKY